MSANYDVVVIGGGVHGAGVAQAAAAAGHTVLVLEKCALASGTSSRSSKLIHGGLRYLEQYDFRLVRECLNERDWMIGHAPDLVHRIAVHLPLYENSRRGSTLIRTGLSLYAALAGFRPGSGFRQIPRSRWDDLDGISTDGLRAVYQFSDAQTDDARLTRSVMESAARLGAVLECPAMATGVELHDDGAAVHYRCGDGDRTSMARVVVNASGPWVNDVLDLVQPSQRARPVDLVKGTHIVLEGTVGGGIYYIEAPRDGRGVFVMPWYGKTLVGTTEKRYHGNQDEVLPSRSEIRYLAHTVDHYFKRYNARQPDAVVASFAGLRVLPAGRGHSFRRSRGTELDSDRLRSPRLLTVYGGKLTAWRATGEQVMQRIAGSLPAPVRDGNTKKVPLPVVD